MAKASGAVAFPVIGGPMPEPGNSVEEFLDQVVRQQPHWLYHLRIRRLDTPHFRSRFLPVTESFLQELAHQFALESAFEVEPLEFIHGSESHPGRRSEYAFGHPPL